MIKPKIIFMKQNWERYAYFEKSTFKKNLVSGQEIDPSAYLTLVWFLDTQEILKTEWCKKIKTTK